MDPDYLTLPPPGAPLGSQGSGFGVVKWWKPEKGVGCIASDATAPWDIWCHFSAIDTVGFRTLEEGQRVVVEFERADQDSFRYRAVRVRVSEDAR